MKNLLSPKAHKILTSTLVAVAIVGDFYALLYIVNLNQITIYLQAAVGVWILLSLFIIFIYDLHFKNLGSWQRAKRRQESVAHKFVRFIRVLLTACWERIEHLRTWEALTTWINYLLLPGFIFWATVTLFFVNLGFYKFQYIILFLSSAALVLNFWDLKEIFSRKTERVDKDIFIRLTVLKIYAAEIGRAHV